MKYFLSLLFICSIVLISLFTIRSLFIPGFFPMHDDTQVARVFEMSQSLHDGMFPVRWVKDLGYGYGYPIFNFYAPFAYYVGGVIAFLGVDTLLATKIMMGIGMLLAGIFMFVFCKEVWGKAGGIIGAVFYVYATYHAVEMYVRGDVAEFFAYAFIPLAAYGVLRATKKRNIFSLFIGSIGFAGVIISHNLTAFMIAPSLAVFAGILTIACWQQKYAWKNIVFPFSPLIGGAALSAFYWLPVLGEMKYTNVLSQIGGGADFRNHFICFSQLWYSQWGFGGSVAGCNDGLSFMVGKLHLLAAGASLIVTLFLFRKKSSEKWWVVGGIVGLLISIFISTAFSRFIWDAFPFMAFFQYPWRFLILISFFTSFLAGGLLTMLKGRNIRGGSAVVLVISVVILQYKFFLPQKILHISSQQYVSLDSLRWHTSRISDEYMPKNFDKPTSPEEIPLTPFSALHASGGIILLLSDKTQEKSMIIDSPTPSEVEAYIAYFPAWRILVDGKEIAYTKAKNGLIVPVSAGKHSVEAQFVSTPIEQWGNAVSITSTVLLILGIIYERRRKMYGKKTS